MNTSEQVSDLFAALVDCQSAIGTVEYDSEVDYTSKGKRTNFQFTSLQRLIEHIKPAMKQSKLAIIQCPKAEEKKVTLSTRLVHTSGQWLETEITMTAASTGAQDLAAVITYAKRYSISSLLLVASGTDNDGGPIDALYQGTDDQKILIKETLDVVGADLETMKAVADVMLEKQLACRPQEIMHTFEEVTRG